MTKWLAVCTQRYSENTASYGYGDWPEEIEYHAAVVEADIIRKAQYADCGNARWHGLPPELIELNNDTRIYTSPVDPRLSTERQERHRMGNERTTERLNFAVRRAAG